MYSFFSRSDIKRVFIFFSRNESNCGCVLYFYIDFSDSCSIKNDRLRILSIDRSQIVGNINKGINGIIG